MLGRPTNLDSSRAGTQLYGLFIIEKETCKISKMEISKKIKKIKLMTSITIGNQREIQLMN